MEFVSNRNFVLRSKSGHAIEFVKGKPTTVPSEVRTEALEKGCLQVDVAGQVEVDVAKIHTDPELRVVEAPTDAAERETVIVKAMKAIIVRNISSEFQGPMPSAGTISMMLGWRVDTKEVRGVWEKHRAALIGNGDGK